MATPFPTRKADKKSPGADPKKEALASEWNGLRDHITAAHRGHGATYDVQSLLFEALGGRRYSWYPRDSYVATLTGDRGEPVRISRSTAATFKGMDGIEITAPANNARIGGPGMLGLLCERAATQKFVNPDAPATQTITDAFGGTKMCAWIEGTGSMTIAVGTATAVGLPATVTAGSPAAFVTSTPGTIVCTVAGSVTFAQVEAEGGHHPTSKIHAAGDRSADHFDTDVSIPSDRFTVDCTVTPLGSWDRTGGMSYYGIWALGTTGDAANEANLHLSANYLVLRIADSAGNLRWLGANVTTLGLLPSSTHRITATIDTTTGAHKLYVDGIDVEVADPLFQRLGAGTAKWTSGAKPTLLHIGRLAANMEFDGHVRAIALAPWADASVNALAPGLNRQSLLTLGDSQTYFYSPYLGQALGSGYLVRNDGISGTRTDEIRDRWTKYGRASRHRWLVLNGGINDFGNGYSAATALANQTAIIEEALADGVRVIVLNATPFGGVAAPYYSTAHEAERVAYNAALEAYCVAEDRIQLIDLDTDFDDGSGALKTAYDSGDHLHYSTAGKLRVVALVTAAMEDFAW